MKTAPVLIAELYELLKADTKKMINSEVKAAMHEAISKFHADQQHPAMLLTESEVLARYKVSRSFLRKLRNKDGLPYIKVGDSIRFEKLKLDEFFMKYQCKK